MPADLSQIKQGMRTMWSAGDFGRIAQYSETVAEEFVDRLRLQPGWKVLDVACGTGNAAIPCARKGTQVTGVDIAANLLDQARGRALKEGLNIGFEEGDAEDLQHPTAEYDLVISMFGAMFAPDPEQVAAELVRVCRPGGTIAMANWTPQGFAGRMFALSARYAPPPDGIPPAALWGDEETVRGRLGAACSRLELMRQRIEMTFPFPPHEVVQFFRDYFGPTRMAFSRLGAAAQTAFASDLEALWSAENESHHADTVVANEYLEVTAIRA